MDKTIRWAVVGTGTIAASFVNDIRFAEGADVTAVCSRDADRARAFAEQHDIAAGLGGLKALLAHSDFDAVYLATPNTAHFEAARKIITAGIPLLIEKPMGVTPGEVEELSRMAEENGTFLMEALWTRYLPALKAAKAAIAEGAIGDVTGFKAELAFFQEFDSESRFFSKDLGGGSLLDLGVYTLSVAEFFLGEAEDVTGKWQSAGTGVDLRADMTYRTGSISAELSCGFDRDGANLCVIEGTGGSIVIVAPFIAARGFFTVTGNLSKDLLTSDNELIRKLAKRFKRLPGTTWHEFPLWGSGLQWQITAASAAIAGGLQQEPEMPLESTIRTLKWIERILASPPSQNDPG